MANFEAIIELVETIGKQYPESSAQVIYEELSDYTDNLEAQYNYSLNSIIDDCYIPRLSEDDIEDLADLLATSGLYRERLAVFKLLTEYNILTPSIEEAIENDKPDYITGEYLFSAFK